MDLIDFYRRHHIAKPKGERAVPGPLA